MEHAMATEDTKFGNAVTENRNYIAEVHSDPDLANLLSIL